MRKRIGRFQPTILSLATAYDDQSGNGELVIPETFDGMSTSDIEALFATASEQFNELYATEGARSDEDLAALAALTEGIEALSAELQARQEAEAERQAQAEALAARVGALSSNTSNDSEEEGDDEGAGDSEEEEGDSEEEAPAEDDNAAEVIVASGARREVRMPIRRRNPLAAQPVAPAAPAVIRSSGEGTGFAVGSDMDFLQIGEAIDRKLQGFSLGQYQAAAGMNRVLKEQHSIATLSRNIPDELMITSDDKQHIDSVFARAADETRLPQGSLVASGGWCAPSETMYEILELESRDGLLSLPEVGIARGGIRFTRGPSFQDIFQNITGFSFTEEEDIDGKYQPSAEGNVVGPKPCYKIECTDFEEVRLEVDGLCLQAGLLQARGYPELIARVVRGALVAHAHRMNALLIQRLVAGSTAVEMGAKVGALAPILDAIELQVEHYRYTHRLPRSTSLEAVFPFWVRGAVRADLARQLGVNDKFDVADAKIDAWFRSRGVNPQFVYNWQDIATEDAEDFTAWPDEVTFLLYSAGTWVRGATPIISIDTLYDSTLLSNNDYTALFTEEGWLVAKRGFDSRVVTVGIEASGGTHVGVDIAHDGSLVVAETDDDETVTENE